MLISRFIAAFQFLTAIPLFKYQDVSTEDLARSTSAFPLVGLALGTIGLLFHLTFGAALPDLLEGALLAGLLVWATRALHIDGVADAVDGMTGGATREDALRIMKDSRIGAAGAAAVCLLLITKAAALGTLPSGSMAWGILLMPTVGRGALAFFIHGADYGGLKPGLGSAFTDHLDSETMWAALAWTALPCLFFGLGGLAAFGFTILYVHLLKGFFERKFGGLTGDLMGFAAETSEVAFLVALHFMA